MLKAPVNLDEVLRTACQGAAGITVEVFRSLLCPEDIDDIAAGGIHPKTLHAYAQSFAEGIRSGRIADRVQLAYPPPIPGWSPP
jgi:hypothetical protein